MRGEAQGDGRESPGERQTMQCGGEENGRGDCRQSPREHSRDCAHASVQSMTLAAAPVLQERRGTLDEWHSR